MTFGSRLEPLTEPQCMALLSTESVGRIGVHIDALPTVLPVKFAVFDHSVVFRAARNSKLHRAVCDAVVAFQADRYGETRNPIGWSVLIRGIAQRIIDPAVLAAAQLLPLGAWSLDGTPDDFVRVEPAIVTGRRFVL
jgi:hypothetical protein